MAIVSLDWDIIGDKCRMSLGLDSSSDLTDLPTTDAEAQEFGIPYAPALWSMATVANDDNGNKEEYYFNGNAWALLGDEGGGGTKQPVESKDVDLVDYDGTIVYSYTKAEFLALDAMPANPSHAGLTAQGWNWTLADAQAYVTSYGGLIIGQMYITADEKTKIYIHLEDRLSPYLGIAVDGTAEVDWGDGTSTSTVTGTSTSTVINTQHTYAAKGNYIISIKVTGTMAFIGNGSGTSGSYLLYNNSKSNADRAYQGCITKIEIGKDVAIGVAGLRYLYGMKTITIPKGVTSIGNYALDNCGSLQCVVIPSSCTSLGSSALSVINFTPYAVIFPKETATLGDTCCNTQWSVRKLYIPPMVTTIPQTCFQNHFSCTEIIIPSSVTTISANAFNSAFGAKRIKFGSSTPPTVSASNAFTSLPTDCTILVPSGYKSAYTSATNYPNSGTYTYEEY